MLPRLHLTLDLVLFSEFLVHPPGLPRLKDAKDELKRKEKQRAAQLKARKASIASKSAGAVSSFWEFADVASVTTYDSPEQVATAYNANKLDNGVPYIVKKSSAMASWADSGSVKSNTALFVASLPTSTQAAAKIKAQCPVPASMAANLAKDMIAMVPGCIPWETTQQQPLMFWGALADFHQCGFEHMAVANLRYIVEGK